MKIKDILTERISLASHYIPVYKNIEKFIVMQPKIDEIEKHTMEWDDFRQTVFMIINTICRVLTQYMEEMHNSSTKVFYVYGPDIDQQLYGEYRFDKDAIIINVNPVLYHFEMFYNKNTTHSSFKALFRKQLKWILYVFFHEVTHSLQTYAIYRDNPNGFEQGVMSLDKSKMHNKDTKDGMDQYYSSHAEIEAFTKMFLHKIIFKDAKKLKGLSGPELSQKIKELINKVIPVHYTKYKGTRSESIYRTVVKKLYLDTMEYLESLKIS